jgi:hypothetical protein
MGKHEWKAKSNMHLGFLESQRKLEQGKEPFPLASWARSIRFRVQDDIDPAPKIFLVLHEETHATTATTDTNLIGNAPGPLRAKRKSPGISRTKL